MPRVVSPVINYVVEEVWRQGHDVCVLDGVQRVGWMLDAWSYALEKSSTTPCRSDALELGRLVERDKNRAGARACGDRVGDDVCPPWQEVPDLLTSLFGRIEGMHCLDFYREFLKIHPFVDGNGRTGKVLLNWINGTLLDPVFPPRDFWGSSIVNP